MNRLVCRVPLDFDAPINETWEPLVMPERLLLDDCAVCGGTGYSPDARHLYDLWYGIVPFDPSEAGSTPWEPTDAIIQSLAQNNVERAPDFYGGPGVLSVNREAQRLCDHFNRRWSHHLSQDDVEALVAEDRLWQFTHKKGEDGRLTKFYATPSASAVNFWSLSGMGHDSINASVAVEARISREGKTRLCAACHGEAQVEAYPGQAAEAKAWTPAEIPTGPGWQMWQDVSEGGPVSPIFKTANELAAWMRTEEPWESLTQAEALHWVTEVAWSPSMVQPVGSDPIDGVTADAKGLR
jgi:hypothetical protein